MRINKNETFEIYKIKRMNNELIKIVGKLTDELTKTEIAAEIVKNNKGDWILSCK